ncbi:MAG: SDR family NAD(P)-dependent oxidoreductase, partial [Candidatus Sericytochromatia bacterium]|nr:SDR family NAD(P)-dependent oxidoreductase [Candidatus Sericytochromatia bacterium]
GIAVPAPVSQPVTPVVPLVAPAPMPAVSAPVVSSPGVDTASVLLAVVSEKTGYPSDTLELDMALEGDLGIDSIKRVEILSALVERLPGAQPIGPEQAGSLQTLRDIVGAFGGAVASPSPSFSEDSMGPGKGDAGLLEPSTPDWFPPVTLSEPSSPSVLPLLSRDDPEVMASTADGVAPLTPAESSPVAEPTGAMSSDPIEALVAPAVVERDERGAGLWNQVRLAPDPAMTLNLRCEHPVAVRLPEAPRLSKPKLPHGAEVWVAGPAGSPLAVTVAEGLQSAGIAASVKELTKDQLWQVPESLAGLILLGPSGAGTDWSFADEEYLRSAFHLVTQAAPRLKAQATQQGAWFATVSRMDGAFGCVDGSQPFNPVSGALAGLAKTAQLEWPDVVAQAFDVHLSWDDAEVALAIVDEIGLPGPVEIGLGPEGRFGLALEAAGPAPLRAAPVKAGELVVLTGGARGVTAEVAVALARAYRPVVALLGRTPLPEAEPAWLSKAQDEASVKRAVAAQAPVPLAPKELEARWQEIAAAREVTQTLGRLQALGVEALYLPVDVRDELAVEMTLRRLTASHGPVRMLVHGAGVLADKYISDKTLAMFDRVFNTKVGGLRALWRAIDPRELRAVVLFSSVTARVGRVGQSDYAMANEVLNKFARRIASTRLETRVVSVGWGPWDGGMVTPALKEIFASEGVGVVPLEAGAAWLAAELGRERHPVPEVVVTGPPVGDVVAPGLSDSAGGTEDSVSASIAHHLESRFKTIVERELAVASHPFLADHVLSGKAVLPVAVMLEWLAAAARASQPQLSFAGFDEFILLKGVVLEGERYGLRFDVGPLESDPQGGGFQVGIRLFGDGRERPLAQATALLRESALPVPHSHWSTGWRGGAEAWPYFRGLDEAYRNVLFHGPEFHALLAVEALGPEGVLGRVKASPRPQLWMQNPVTDAWLTEPLAIDAMFQLLILWSVETLGAPCLPCRVAHFRQYRPFVSSAYTVAVHVTARRVGTLLADAAFIDAAGELVAEFRGAECTFNAGLVEAFKRNTLASSAIL